MIRSLGHLLEIGAAVAVLCTAACRTEPSPSPARTPAPRAPSEWLQRAIEQRVDSLDGVAGCFVARLGDGGVIEPIVALRADELFPAASLIKVPILIALFERIERGELAFRQQLRFDATRATDDGDDLLARFADGETIDVAHLVALMCTFSDNSASLWLQELAGGGMAINGWLATHGFEQTRVNSRTAGREAEQQEWGWGQTTPREVARLLACIRARRAVSMAADLEMERALSRSFWTGEALSVLPPQVHALSKQGAVNRSRSEVLLVDARSGPYLFCAITKAQADTSWTHENAGFELLRDLSALTWRWFEPDTPQVPVGDRRFE